MTMMFSVSKYMILAVTILVTITSAAFSEVSEDFYGYNKPVIPYENEIFFPSMGDIESYVMIDFFYNYDCMECKEVSKFLTERVNDKKDIRVIFHPIPQNEKEYEIALLEHISFTEGKNLFSNIHQNIMNNVVVEEFSLKYTLQEIYSINQELAVNLFDKFANEKKYNLGLNMSNEIARKADVKSLPTLIINNKIFEISKNVDFKKIEEVIILEKARVIQEELSKKIGVN